MSDLNVVIFLRSTGRFNRQVTGRVGSAHENLNRFHLCRATCCITAKVLQTKVDAQCDKLATELSWQRLLRRFSLSSYSELIIKSSQFRHSPPAFGASPQVTPLVFCRDTRRQKTRIPGLSCGVVCVIRRSSQIPLRTSFEPVWVQLP